MKTLNTGQKLRRIARMPATFPRWAQLRAALEEDPSYGRAGGWEYLTGRPAKCTPLQYVNTLLTLGTLDAQIIHHHGPRDLRATGEGFTISFADLFADDLRAPDSLEDVGEKWELFEVGDYVELDDDEIADLAPVLRQQFARTVGDHNAFYEYAGDVVGDVKTAARQAVAQRVESEVYKQVIAALFDYLDHMAPDAGIVVGWPLVNRDTKTPDQSIWEATRITLFYTARRCRELGRQYQESESADYWWYAIQDLASDAPRVVGCDFYDVFYIARDDREAAIDLLENGGIETCADLVASASRHEWRPRLKAMIKARAPLAERDSVRRAILGIPATGKHGRSS